MCDLSLSIGANARVVVAPFTRRHFYGVFVRRSVLGHSAWLLASLVGTLLLWGICSAVGVGSQCVMRLASLVGTYGVFVPRSVLGHSA